MPSKHWSSVKTAFTEFAAIRPLQLSAALSYYTLLSLAPLVLVAVAVASVLFERASVEQRVIQQIRTLVGDAGADVVETVLQHAAEADTGTISLVVGAITLLAGATAVFVQLQDALNQIWHVEARPSHSAIIAFVRHRLLSLAMVLAIGFLLLVSLMVSAALAATSDWILESRGLLPQLLKVADVAATLCLVTVLFGLIFRFLPDVRVPWRDTWYGAMTTALLFTVGKYLIGAYLGHSDVGSAFGAAGSVVVLMVWIYYAALILFVGAHVTRVRGRRRAARIAPKAYAAKVAATHTAK